MFKVAGAVVEVLAFEIVNVEKGGTKKHRPGKLPGTKGVPPHIHLAQNAFKR